MYEYLRKNKQDKYKLIWIYSDKNFLPEHPYVKGYYKFSFKAFYYYARAKYVFCTHGIYSFLNLKHKNKIVNLWHGMPLKNIGCMDSKNCGTTPTKADYLIATSSFFQKIMAVSFNNLDINKVLLVGQPRNDQMFEETDFFKNRDIDTTQYNSIGIWLPTYRQSIIGDVRSDGVYNENGITFLSMDDLHQLDKFLKEISSLLIVKLHPMDALQKANFEDFKNLIIIKPKDFKEQLYPLLGSVNYLLTDYSSVWIDYCILRRPIGFVMNDIEEYKNSRGLTIDELDKKLPGEIIDNYEKLINFIMNPPKFIDTNLELYNLYCDNNASKRIADYFKL